MEVSSCLYPFENPSMALHHFQNCGQHFKHGFHALYYLVIAYLSFHILLLWRIHHREKNHIMCSSSKIQRMFLTSHAYLCTCTSLCLVCSSLLFPIFTLQTQLQEVSPVSAECPQNVSFFCASSIFPIPCNDNLHSVL